MPRLDKDFLRHNFEGSSFVWRNLKSNPAISIFGLPLLAADAALLPVRTLLRRRDSASADEPELDRLRAKQGMPGSQQYAAYAGEASGQPDTPPEYSNFRSYSPSGAVNGLKNEYQYTSTQSRNDGKTSYSGQHSQSRNRSHATVRSEPIREERDNDVSVASKKSLGSRHSASTPATERTWAPPPSSILTRQTFLPTGDAGSLAPGESASQVSSVCSTHHPKSQGSSKVSGPKSKSHSASGRHTRTSRIDVRQETIRNSRIPAISTCDVSRHDWASGTASVNTDHLAYTAELGSGAREEVAAERAAIHEPLGWSWRQHEGT